MAKYRRSVGSKRKIQTLGRHGRHGLSTEQGRDDQGIGTLFETTRVPATVEIDSLLAAAAHSGSAVGRNQVLRRSSPR